MTRAKKEMKKTLQYAVFRSHTATAGNSKVRKETSRTLVNSLGLQETNPRNAAIEILLVIEISVRDEIQILTFGRSLIELVMSRKHAFHKAAIKIQCV